MKRAKLFFTLFFYLFFSIFLLNAQATGYELSTRVYNQFNHSKLNIRTQSLVTSSENQFPFNVFITFNSDRNTRDFSSKQLLIVFDQAQSIKNIDLINTLLKSLQEADYNFPITVLFSYDDTPNVLKKDNLYGTKVYLNNSNINENTTALIVDLNNTKNTIITSSNGIASPSILVKNSLNLFLKSGITTALPIYYVSQQNRYKFFTDNQLDFFFEQEIPAIKFTFTVKTSVQSIFDICNQFINNYSNEKDLVWDQYFIILKIFNTYRRLTEQTIVTLIIILFFICTLFIFLLGFVNASIKNKTWKKIKKIWYAAPIIFILILLAFLFGKVPFLWLGKNLTYTGKIVFLLLSQLFWSFLFTSVYFIIQIKKGNEILSEKAIDFLIVFTSSLNLFIFSFMDISLFPIFLLTVILSILLLIFNKRFLHIVLFICMIIPYIPYIHTIFTYADIYLFQQSFTHNNYFFIVESLLLTPIILTYFRILTSFKTKLFTYKRLIIVTSTAFVFFMTILTVTGAIITRYHTQTFIAKNPVIPEVSKKTVTSIKWKDKKIFTDNIRTLQISLPANTIQCEVLISTEDSSPVLYSNSDYVVTAANQASFLIPSNPAKSMVFTYGFDKPESKITVNTIYFDSLTGTYLSNTSTKITGDTNGK